MNFSKEILQSYPNASAFRYYKTSSMVYKRVDATLKGRYSASLQATILRSFYPTKNDIFVVQNLPKHGQIKNVTLQCYDMHIKLAIAYISLILVVVGLRNQFAGHVYIVLDRTKSSPGDKISTSYLFWSDKYAFRLLVFVIVI